MRQHKDDKLFCEYFDNLQDFYKTINTRDTNTGFKDFQKKGHKLSSKDTRNADWYGTADWEQAESLATKGDPNSVKLIKTELIKAEKETAPVSKNQVKRDVVGFAPCVPAYLAGHPQSMINKRRTVMHAPKVINILYNATTTCATTSQDRVNSCAAFLSAVNSLQLKGYRFNLYTCFNAYEYAGADKKRIQLYIKMKDAGDHTQISSLAFPLINTSFYRRYVFRWIETIPVTKQFIKEFFFGYGYCDEVKKSDIKQITGREDNTNWVAISGRKIRESAATQSDKIKTIAANIIAGKGEFCND